MYLFSGASFSNLAPSKVDEGAEVHEGNPRVLRLFYNYPNAEELDEVMKSMNEGSKEDILLRKFSIDLSRDELDCLAPEKE